MDILNSVKSFLDIAKDNALQDFKSENTEYRNLVEQRNEQSERIYKMINELGENRANEIKNFFTLNYKIQDIENAMLYNQGHKDTLTILQHMRII